MKNIRLFFTSVAIIGLAIAASIVIPVRADVGSTYPSTNEWKPNWSILMADPGKTNYTMFGSNILYALQLLGLNTNGGGGGSFNPTNVTLFGSNFVSGSVIFDNPLGFGSGGLRLDGTSGSLHAPGYISLANNPGIYQLPVSTTANFLSSADVPNAWIQFSGDPAYQYYQYACCGAATDVVFTAGVNMFQIGQYGQVIFNNPLSHGALSGIELEFNSPQLVFQDEVITNNVSPAFSATNYWGFNSGSNRLTIGPMVGVSRVSNGGSGTSHVLGPVRPSIVISNANGEVGLNTPVSLGGSLGTAGDVFTSGGPGVAGHWGPGGAGSSFPLSTDANFNGHSATNAEAFSGTSSNGGGLYLGPAGAGGAAGLGITNLSGVGYYFSNSTTHAEYYQSPNGHIKVVDQWGTVFLYSTNGTVDITQTNGNGYHLTNGTLIISGVLSAAGITNTGLSAAQTLVITDANKKSLALANGGANTVPHGTTPPAYSAVVEGDLGLTDLTTANASSSAHGFLKKLSGNATDFMNGAGNWAVPPGSGGGGLALRNAAGGYISTALFSSGTSRYVSPFGATMSSTETSVALAMPACTLTNLYITSYALGANTNCTVTVFTNGVASNIAASIVGSASVQVGVDTTHGVPIPDQCKVSLRFSGDNTSNDATGFAWCLQCY